MKPGHQLQFPWDESHCIPALGPRWSSCAPHSTQPNFSFRLRFWIFQLSPLVCTLWWPQSWAPHWYKFSWGFSFFSTRILSFCSPFSFFARQVVDSETKVEPSKGDAYNGPATKVFYAWQSFSWFFYVHPPLCFVTSGWCNNAAHWPSSGILSPGWNCSQWHEEELIEYIFWIRQTEV